MRKSIKNKLVRAVSSYHEDKSKAKNQKHLCEIETCLHCTENKCNGYCDKVRGKI